jgi:hypothetical protein
MKEILKYSRLSVEEIMERHKFYMKHIIKNDGIKNRNYHCNKIDEDRSEEYLSINNRGKNGLHFSPRRKRR